MITACYQFYDVLLELSLPKRLASDWRVLYGAFESKNIGRPNLHIVCEEDDGDLTVFVINGKRYSWPNQHVMMWLQDVVQNTILPSVRSHLLWHGALWSCEGQGVMILGASGIGKTTLSMAERYAGGVVWSDEIAAWSMAEHAMVPFPRGFAARLRTYELMGMEPEGTRLHLDEEKRVVPPLIVDQWKRIPLAAVCVMEWPQDPAAMSGADVCEFRVLSSNPAWSADLGRELGGARLMPHPDGDQWWRCEMPQAISAHDMTLRLQAHEATLTHFHHGARRRPDYQAAPEWKVVPTEVVIGMALGELVNGRHMLDVHGPARMMAAIREVFRDVPCIHCVPGRLEETRQFIRSLPAAALASA
jgi:hypothetical protein